MKMIQRMGVVALVAVMALTLGGVSSFAKEKKEKKGKHAGGARKIAGEVTAIDATAKTITIERTHLEKKQEKQYTLTDQTVYEQKHKKKVTPLTVADVHVGVKVVITASGTDATKIEVVGGSKHKGKGGHKGKK